MNMEEEHELQEPQENLLRPFKAAALMGVTPETIRVWYSKGIIEAITTPGGQLRIPENEVNFEQDILNPIKMGSKRNKTHYIIILAEGVPNGDEYSARIEEATGVETRMTTLGYLQRGGSPTVVDRVNASLMGARSVELLRDGNSNRIIGMKNNKIYDIDIYEGLKMECTEPNYLIKLAQILTV